MKVLIIGYGSIAKKHHAALKKLSKKLQIFALRSQKNCPEFIDVHSIYSWKEAPTDLDFIIISNPTSEHAKTIIEANKLNVPLFIEKPPLFHLSEKNDVLDALSNSQILTYCAFPLRFHPIIQWLKKNIKPSEVLEFRAYCGSFLPDWRPNEDYRKNYSAIKQLGGGVHLDLIHELDYLKWIFGLPKSSKGFTKKVSNLEINSVDSTTYFVEYMSSIGVVQLNYFRKQAKRTFEYVTSEDSFQADLLNYTVTNSKGNVIFETEKGKTDLYLQQMDYFLNKIENKSILMNSFEESCETLALCLNVEEL
jgi:predicted dehydrogenase